MLSCPARQAAVFSCCHGKQENSLIHVPLPKMGVVNGKFLFNLKHSLKVIVMLGILMPPRARGRQDEPPWSCWTRRSQWLIIYGDASRRSHLMALQSRKPKKREKEKPNNKNRGKWKKLSKSDREGRWRDPLQTTHVSRLSAARWCLLPLAPCPLPLSICANGFLIILAAGLADCDCDWESRAWSCP